MVIYKRVNFRGKLSANRKSAISWAYSAIVNTQISTKYCTTPSQISPKSRLLNDFIIYKFELEHNRYRYMLYPGYRLYKEKKVFISVLQIRIRDPGSGAFLTPGSGIRNGFFPDPGSRIPDPKTIF